MRRALALAVALTVWPCVALAHAGVDRARALVDEGRFEEADAALAQALASNALTRDDLIALFEARALLDHARGDQTGLERTLRALASVSPSHQFGPRFPPDLAARFVEIGRTMGGRLRLRVDRRPGPGGVSARPRVEGDAASLVSVVRVRVFDVTTGTWAEVAPPVTAAPGRDVLLFVEAIGPGGAVLAAEGSAEAPIRLGGPRTEDNVPEPTLTPARRGGIPDWVVVVIVVAAVLAVGAAIGGIVYAVENPEVSWDPPTPTSM